MPPILFATKDNAEGQLNATISPSATAIPMQMGNGNEFPQPYNGNTTSGGSATALNCTGILALIGAGAVGKPIRNVTDNSLAFIKSITTNQVVTTPLLGGSDNTWQNSDEWQIDECVLTLAKVNGNGEITQHEQTLIKARSGDTFTARTRGYNGTTAAQFDTGDRVYLFVTSPVQERVKDYLNELAKLLETNAEDIESNTTRISDIESGAYDYVVATGSSNAYVVASPAFASYAAGQYLVFKANFTNTGAATINVNALGAKSIRKLDGATALASGDIVSGQIVVLRYDGTNFQMLSPIANQSTIVVEDADFVHSQTEGNTGGAASNDDSVQSTSSLTAFANTFTALANFLQSEGDRFQILAYGRTRSKASAAGTITLAIQVGGQTLATFTATMTDNQDNQAWRIEADAVCKVPGASGKLYAVGRLRYEGSSTKDYYTQTYDTRGANAEVNMNTTVSNVIRVVVQFSAADVANYADLEYFGIVKLRDIN